MSPAATTPTTTRCEGETTWSRPGSERANTKGHWTQDPEGTSDATYRTVAVDGDVAVATGHSTYWAARGGPIDRVYDNCFVVRFDPQEGAANY